MVYTEIRRDLRRGVNVYPRARMRVFCDHAGQEGHFQQVERVAHPVSRDGEEARVRPDDLIDAGGRGSPWRMASASFVRSA